MSLSDTDEANILLNEGLFELTDEPMEPSFLSFSIDIRSNE